MSNGARLREWAKKPADRARLGSAMAAVAFAGAVAGITYATREHPPQPHQQCHGTVNPLIVPGVRSTNIAVVRTAFSLQGKAIPLSLETLAERAGRDYRRDPVLQYNFGFALLCSGYFADAVLPFQRAKRFGRNTFYEMRADELLHPQYFIPQDGLYPVFQPTRPNTLLTQGVTLERQGHQHSAERAYRRAAAAEPANVEAKVAVAVGRFDESNLTAVFSRLGPLSKQYPNNQSVHFHFGLLLAWTGFRAGAIRQFTQAVALGKDTKLGVQAEAFLKGLKPSNP